MNNRYQLRDNFHLNLILHLMLGFGRVHFEIHYLQLVKGGRDEQSFALCENYRSGSLHRWVALKLPSTSYLYGGPIFGFACLTMLYL